MDSISEISPANAYVPPSGGRDFLSHLDEQAAPSIGTGAANQNPQVLFGHDPSPDDIHQNSIGDCYLDSTMGEIARQDPGALRSMVHDNGNGTYDVTLHRTDNDLHNLGGLFGNDYKDQHITVTPQPQPGGVNTQTPDPVRTAGAHELWPQLIENAYAQQQGGVANIAKGGSPSAAMQSLTGHTAKDMDVSSYGSKRLLSDLNNGKLIVLSTNTQDQLNATNKNQFGLVGGHAYMVTAASLDAQGQLMVKLQNPWGVATSPGTFVKAVLPYSQLQPYLSSVSVGRTH